MWLANWMIAPEAPLRWPDSFPPRTRREQFFLGVRWLGPDLSFFDDLRRSQAARTLELFSASWAEPERTNALAVGTLIQRHIGWRTPYFLPRDAFAVIAYGPRFQSMDDLLFASFADAIDDEIGPPGISDEIWSQLLTGDFSEVVTAYGRR